MRRDYLGNPVTVESEATLAGIDDFVGGFLSYEQRIVNILAAADADPGCCLANVYAGVIWMFLEAPEAPAHAAAYIARAEAAAPGATDRERGALEHLKAWAAEDYGRALAIADEILADHPRDLALMKLAQYHAFNLGDFPRMLRLAHAVEDACRDVPHWHGMAAFGYEQCHLLDEAERAATRAIELQRKEPWAHHALAHVMLTQGRIREGIRFLDGVRDTWTDLNSFMHTHAWWHLALFHLSEGEFDRVLAIYDRDVWGIAKDYSQDQVGAVSLLARMEVAGVDVGDRWRDVGEYLSRRHADTVQPFLTMQYLYGLAHAGLPQAGELMEAVRKRAATAPAPLRPAWAEVALPACEGLLAHAAGDWSTARTLLGRALPRMAEIGGSHAQRDLFEQLHLDAVVKGGSLIEAQQMLERRRAHEPDGVPLNRLLADVYAKLGLPAEAAAAARRTVR